MSYSCQSRFVRNIYCNRPVQDSLSIKGCVDFFVFQNSVYMYTSRCGVKVNSDKRLVSWDLVAHFLFKIVSYFCNYGSINAIFVPNKGNIFHDQAFYRGISSSLSNAQESSIGMRAPIEPGANCVYYYLVKIVVPMPLKALRRHTGIVYHRPY